MAAYYVNQNAQSTGEHEVHKSGCSYMPDANNRKYLDEFADCQEAVKAAENIYNNVDGCYFCCKPCHSR